MYSDISDALLCSSQEFVKERVVNNDHQVAGWKEYCSSSHGEARAAFLEWASHGKPRQGHLFDNMSRSRAYFKYTLRQCRANQDRIQSDNLARKLLSTKTKQFWKEVNKISGSVSAPLAFTVDNTSGQKNICDLWKNHYDNILNLTKDEKCKSKVLSRIVDCTSPDSPFTPDEIASVIKDLKNGKACGRDRLQSEHFKYGSDKLSVLLCLLFNAMIIHGYLCEGLMDTVLIPIVKDKKGDISCKDNYRPIALTSVISKLLESVILSRYHFCLLTSHNQFGFKEDHSTDLCTFMLKQFVDYYNKKYSPVFIC